MPNLPFLVRQGQIPKAYMKPLRLLLVSLASLFCNVVFSQVCTVTVNITGLRTSKGTVYVSLYNQSDGYPKEHAKAFKVAHSVVLGNKCKIMFEGLPEGVYAVACYHDENDNGKIDTNFLGIPKEGTGASNNAKGFMGPPSFNSAQFKVAANITEEIQIYY